MPIVVQKMPALLQGLLLALLVHLVVVHSHRLALELANFIIFILRFINSFLRGHIEVFIEQIIVLHLQLRILLLCGLVLVAFK